MLQSQATTMDALHSLADGKAMSFTEHTKLSAHGAIMAVEGRTREPEPEMDGERMQADKHIMMSYVIQIPQFPPDSGSMGDRFVARSRYQWTHQPTVERIVRSLQARGFLLWFDLDLMKGNTME